MPGRIPESLLEDILARVDIVELISSYIPLKKAGRNFKANCPFHHEKTPSFMVSPDRQIYHCFGCGESGNAFKFLMRHERMEFLEAVEVLARKAGIVLPDQDNPQAAKTASLSAQVYKVNELALGFYENNLNTQAAASCREYLLKRGIKPQTAKQFHLGLALSAWDGLIGFLKGKGVGFSVMEKAGLVLPKNGGGYYDRFRSRIIFPIFDIRGRAIGFGARVMDESLPKYINSPETPVYVKGKNLFGLNLSKDHIRERDFAIIVEGYMDFIIPFQEGLNNLAASQGTALTTEQIRLLKRYTHNVVMVYDGDNAGEIATLRSLDMLIEEGMQVRIAPLPKGMDPDTLVRKEGPGGMNNRIGGAKTLFDYKLNILKNRYNIKEAHGKGRIAMEMLSTISRINNAIVRGEYIRRLAEEIGVSEQNIIEELGKLKEPPAARADGDIELKKVSSGANPAEKLLLKFMLEEKDLIEKVLRELSPEDFSDARTAEIVSLMHDLFSQGKSVEPSVLMNYFNEDEASQLVCESMFMPELSGQERERAVNDCIARIKIQRLKSRRESLHMQIKSAQSSGDEQRLNSLIKEFHNLIKKGE